MDRVGEELPPADREAELRSEVALMPRVLLVHGAGMDMRGRSEIEKFGPRTLAEYDVAIRGYASILAIELEIVQSNAEEDVIDRIRLAPGRGIDAILINPAGFTRGFPALATAIEEAGIPAVEVHMSNPARREITSQISRVASAVVTGFGMSSYHAALLGLREMLAARPPRRRA